MNHPQLRRRALLSCIAAGVLALCQLPQAAADSQPLRLEPCDTDSLTGEAASARCGWLEVNENPDDAASRRIQLRVTVIPALRVKPQEDPLVILAGGPGQSAHDAYSGAAPAFGSIRRDRDILLLDQRGTGESNRLDCAFNDPAQLESADPEQLQPLAQRCLSELSGDPRFYTTSIAVRDLEAARAALGYPQLSLYAGSYGTRVAQHYLRRYPDRVRLMILDGVVPVDLALGPDIAPRAQQALDAMFDRCTADKACNRAFPRVREQFGALRTRLDRDPIRARLADPVTAQMQDATFGIQQLNVAVRLLTYSDETASLLPLLIHEAHSADQPEPFMAQYFMVRKLTDLQFAYGMHFAVVCSEDAPRWTQQDVSNSSLDGTYLGQAFMQGMKSVCDIWPRGVVDDAFNAPLRSDVPVLVLSGGNDPVTPAAYGERAMESFPRARHLVLAGQGHGQLATGCMPRVIAQFVASASTDVDARCLDTVAPAPFLLSRTGAGP